VAGQGRLRLRRCSRLLAVAARVGSGARVCERVLSQMVLTGLIPTSVLAGGLRALQERD
jgi:hypothetical protein